jgi:hypothetical protein
MKTFVLDAITKTLAKEISKTRVPAQPAAKCDLRYVVREQRLALQKQVDALQKLETSLNEYFILNLPKSQASGIAGKVARVQLQRKIVPQVQSGDVDGWSLLHQYIARTKSWDLLQKRLNNGAVESRWEEKVEIPGVVPFHTLTVSCTKL